MGFWSTLGDIGKDVGGLLGPIGSIAGTVIDYASKRDANKASAGQAKAAQDFSAEQASTQYQRSVKDMTAAGLNPGQFYSGGGGTDAAATGVQAPVQPRTDNTSDKLRGAIDAYNAFATSSAQRQLIREQTNLTSQQGLNAAADYSIKTPAAKIAQNPDFISSFNEQQMADLRNKIFQSNNAPTAFQRNLQEVDARISTNAAQQRMMNTQATLGEQQFTNAFFRKNIAPYLNSTAATMKALESFVPDMGFKP